MHTNVFVHFAAYQTIRTQKFSWNQSVKLRKNPTMERKWIFIVVLGSDRRGQIYETLFERNDFTV